jgi:hypothetical protein
VSWRGLANLKGICQTSPRVPTRKSSSRSSISCFFSLLHLTTQNSPHFPTQTPKLAAQNPKFLTDDLLTVEILEQSASDNASRQSNQFNSIEKTEENSTPQVMKRPPVPTVNAIAASADVSSDDEEVEKQQVGGKRHSGTAVNNLKHRHGSKGALPSPLGSAHSFDMQVGLQSSFRMSSIQRNFRRSPTGAWRSSKSTQSPDQRRSSSTAKVNKLLLFLSPL